MTKKTMVSFSGGKNSTAMLLRLIELEEKIDYIVFADTLMEFPEVYVFLEEVEKRIKRKITRLKPQNHFLKWFFKPFSRGKFKDQIHGFPYVITPCWYQREAKARPLDRFVRENNITKVYVGYCKGEENRSVSWKWPELYHYPLIEWGWTDQYCFDYCKEKNLLNPLYAKFQRTGCWCCPKQSKKALRILKKDYPALWNLLLQLEELSPHGFNITRKEMISHYNKHLVLDQDVNSLEFLVDTDDFTGVEGET